MNVVLGSAFRNSAKRIPAYMDQASSLQFELSKNEFGRLRLVAIEGDSTDDTALQLRVGARAKGLDIDVVSCVHGCPEFGSVETPERMRALSKVGNAIFDSIRSWDDILVYVESDLLWDPKVIVKLIRYALCRYREFDVFAPLTMAGQYFYDVWAARGLDGNRFTPFVPFYPGLFTRKVIREENSFDGAEAFSLTEIEPFEVSSMGSCLVMPGYVARICRIWDDNCLVGWCADARSKGFRIAVVPSLRINHP